MVKYIVVSDRPVDFITPLPDVTFMRATDFIANAGDIDLRKAGQTRLINLCRDYDYLSKGYYCSLLAQARGMRCIPSVSNILTLNWKRLYQTHLPELNGILKATYKNPNDEPSAHTYNLYFGRCRDPQLEELGRRIFDLFRFPLIQIEIELDHNGEWVISNIEYTSVTDLPQTKNAFFNESLKKFTGSAWRNEQGVKYKNWVAILHDPKEKRPPSNKAAIQKFIKAGKQLDIAIEMITKSDFAALSEYDALLIRETTAINNHTFRFAHKAESEFMPAIDDTKSIIRCCNKVFQYEILESNNIPLPKTWIFDTKRMKETSEKTSYPAVVKIPDGAFSVGVFKVNTVEEFMSASAKLLKNSGILLAQEFVTSEFDWRIGVLNNKPLFACKYYMAKGHWQIYNNKEKSVKMSEGDSETLPVSDVPQKVLDIALKAASLMGDGLYGVDLKQNGDKIVVMEINDNPSIDSGVEDLVLGDQLYIEILKELVSRIA